MMDSLLVDGKHRIPIDRYTHWHRIVVEQDDQQNFLVVEQVLLRHSKEFSQKHVVIELTKYEEKDANGNED